MAARRAGLLCLPAALLLLWAGGRARATGAVPASSSEAFDSVLGNTASCHRACQLTYSLHTYPKEEELYCGGCCWRCSATRTSSRSSPSRGPSAPPPASPPAPSPGGSWAPARRRETCGPA